MTAFTLLISPGMRGGSSRSVSRWTAHWVETGLTPRDISGHHPEQEREQGEQDIEEIDVQLSTLEKPQQGGASRKGPEDRVSQSVQDRIRHVAFKGPIDREASRHLPAVNLGPENPSHAPDQAIREGRSRVLH